MVPAATRAGPPGYALGPLIGRGASGRVYAATGPAGEAAAVKEVRPAAAGPPVLTPHPHLLPTTLWWTAGGVTQVVMPLARGGSVQRLLGTGFPLPVDWTVRVITQTAAALEHLHAAGWLHLDVKPSNILLTGEGDALLGDLDTLSPVAAPQARGGTVAYLAPEHLAGGPPNRDRDTYGLAATAYHLLCGARPFPAGRGARAAAGAAAQRRQQHCCFVREDLRRPRTPAEGSAPRRSPEPLPPPVGTAPGPRAFNPGLPIAVAAVLQRALAPHPGDRYPSPTAFATALAAAARQGPPGHPPPWQGAAFAAPVAAIIALAAALAAAAPLALAALLGMYLLTLGAIRAALPAWAGRLVVAAPGVLLAPGRPISARRGLSALLHNAASLALATAAAAALMGAGGDGAAGGALVAPLTAGGALAGAALTARAGVAGLGLAVVLAAPVWAVWLGAGAWLVAGQGVAGLLLGRRRWLPWLRAARAAWVRRR